MRIVSESPIQDQWRLLNRFAYPRNVSEHLQNHGFTAADESTVEFVAGCLRQSEAYFVAAAGSPLDISPLVMYYGAANLLAGSAALLTGTRPPIKHHGMVLIVPPARKRIADIEVKPVNGTKGALQLFSNIFSNACPLVNGAAWTVEEILGSVPDLKREFETCYAQAVPWVIPVEIILRREASLERIAASELARYASPQEALARVSGLSDAYLPPQTSNQMDHIVLYRRMGAAHIGTHAISGRKYLQIAHQKRGRCLSPSQLIVLYMGLFALGHLSRYYPEFWSPFVKSDETGEKLVVERFLAICERYFPNLVLNTLYATRVQFVYEQEGTVDMSTIVTENDLREMLERQLRHTG